MKPLIGALTAGIALADITEACRQIGDKSEVLYLSYQNYDQAGSVLNANIKKLDGVIYGGPRGYQAAALPEDSGIPYEVLRIGKADFFELLLKIILVDKISIDRVSVDFIDEQDQFGGLQSLIPDGKMPYVYTSEIDPPDIEDILRYHIDLYEQGKIDCVTTRLATISKVLRSKGIKHYYIQPSVYTIADALERVTNKALAKAVSGGLSVLGIVKYENGDYYNLYRLLSEFASTNCPHMVVNRNADSCHLITQKRWFDELTHNCTQATLTPWLAERGVSASIGWGVGTGLGAASDHAAIALEQSLAQGEGYCYVTSEDGMVTGPIGTSHSFSYSREITPALQLISERSGLSVLYIQKLKGMWEQIPQHYLSCEDIGRYLNISRRSANRVLNQLEQSGYAAVILVNKQGGRGRPTKMYTLNLD